MEKDKYTNQVGSSLPPSGRHSGNLNGKLEIPTPSTTLPMKNFGQFSHDISQMSENPSRNMGHRRAHSDFLSLPDDISFDSGLGVVDGFDGPLCSDDTEDDLLEYTKLDKFNESSAPALAFQLDDDVESASNERPRIRHQHSQSMDGSTTIKPELLESGGDEACGSDSTKAISAAKLAELALVDPKRAKRIWANRQSAARSKERKMRYISELERKVRSLQTEATTMSGQLCMLRGETSGLAAGNSELKLRLQSIEQQVHLQDALNEGLKEELQYLKLMTGQANVPNTRQAMNFPTSFGSNQQSYPNDHALNSLAQQFHKVKLQSLQQQFQQLQQQRMGDFDMRGSSSSRSHINNASDINP